jgi:delta-aminolevulinic acid dehydratase/porphobilinogen synthase
MFYFILFYYPRPLPRAPCVYLFNRLKQSTNLPIAAYHVSGEYAMLKAASQKGMAIYLVFIF